MEKCITFRVVEKTQSRTGNFNESRVSKFMTHVGCFVQQIVSIVEYVFLKSGTLRPVYEDHRVKSRYVSLVIRCHTKAHNFLNELSNELWRLTASISVSHTLFN